MKHSCIFLVLLASASAQVSKLDRLSDVMTTIKTLATGELHELEVTHRSDSAQIATIMTELTAEQSYMASRKNQLDEESSTLRNSVLAELQSKINVTKDESATIASEVQRTTGDWATFQKQSVVDLDSMRHDMDMLMNLTQQIASTVQQSNQLTLAQQQAGKAVNEIALKRAYDGPAFTESCDTKEELSNILASLLEHVQSALYKEEQHVIKVNETFSNYLRELEAKRQALVQIGDSYAQQEANTQARLDAIAIELAEISGKDSQLQSRIDRLTEYKDWLIQAFASRSSLVTETVEKANGIVQLVTLLQAKLAVRSVNAV